MNPTPEPHAPAPQATPPAAGQKPDVGAVMRAERVKKGHSLDAAFRQTRIPKKLLEALENNRFDEFPAEAYLRGFMKGYCDFLELDFEALWLLHAPAKPPEPPAPDPGTAAAAAHAPAAKAPSAKKDAHGRADEEHASSGGGIAPWIWGGVIAAAIAAAIMIGRRDAPPEPPAAPAMPAALEPVHEPKQAKLVIEFRNEAWVRVGVDGQTRFEGKVPRGSRQEWSAKRELTLSTPSPKDVKLQLNGQPHELVAPDPSGVYHIPTGLD